MMRSLGVFFLTALLAASVLIAPPASAYYLPGTFPQAYTAGAVLRAEVNSVTSYDSELPYDYYSLPFCRPEGGVKAAAHNVNIGTLLMGQKIQNSPYKFTLMKDEENVQVCKPDGFYGPMSKDEVKDLEEKIALDYRVKLILDNLPVTTQDLEEDESVRTGFDIGYSVNGEYFVNNHLSFIVLVHPVSSLYSDGIGMFETNSYELEGRRLLEDEDGNFFTVVGFEVRACSANHAPGNPVGVNMVCMDTLNAEQAAAGMGMKIIEGARIPYTYDVTWKTSETKWASRWDAYLKMPRGQVHWFSLINSFVVVVVLAGVVMIILLRTIRRDLVKYEEILGDSEADFKEEFGWKLVMGDVFRAPKGAKSLCVQVGTGVQILLCSLVTLIFAAMGFLSPASRGALLSTCIGMYILLSVVAGYVAVWLHGMMTQTQQQWTSVATRTSAFFPGIIMLILTCLNLLLRHTGTSGAIPLKAYFMILGLWGLVSVPLCLLGGYIASKRPIVPYPVRTNQIPRQIPPQKIPSFVFFLGSGLLVFGNIFIVLYFTMTSVWQGYFYYLFGFVLMAGLLTIIITAQVSVVATYLQLCTEDYQWWWTSFTRGGAVAAYVAVYALSFLVSSLSHMHGALSVSVYLCYMGMFTYGLYLMMGTVGFLASYYFSYRIFASVKSD